MLKVNFLNEIKNYKINIFDKFNVFQIFNDEKIRFELDKLSVTDLGLILSLIYVLKIEDTNQLVKINSQDHDENIIELSRYLNELYLLSFKDNFNIIKKQNVNVINYLNNLSKEKISAVLNSKYSPNYLIETLSNNKSSKLGYLYLSAYSYVNEKIWDDLNSGYISRLNILRDRYAKELFNKEAFDELIDLKSQKFYETPCFKGGSSLDFMIVENYVRFGEETILNIMRQSFSEESSKEEKNRYLYYFSSMSNSIIRDDEYKMMARVGQKYFKNLNIYAKESEKFFNEYHKYQVFFLNDINEKGKRYANELLKFIDINDLDKDLIKLNVKNDSEAQVVLDINSLTSLDFYNKYVNEKLSDLKNLNFLEKDKGILNQVLSLNGWFFYIVKLTNDIQCFFEDNYLETELKMFVNKEENNIMIDLEIKSEDFTIENIYSVLSKMISLTYKKEENMDNKKSKEMNYQILETIVNRTLMKKDVKSVGFNKQVKKF